MGKPQVLLKDGSKGKGAKKRTTKLTIIFQSRGFKPYGIVSCPQGDVNVILEAQ